MEFEPGPVPCQERNRRWVRFAAVSLLIGYLVTLSNVSPGINDPCSEFFGAYKTPLNLTMKINRDWLSSHTVHMAVKFVVNQHKTIQDLIENEIEKIYSDKTGRTDFALESAGGRIVQLTTGTENYEKPKHFAGISLCEGMHGPRAMIQSNMNIGNCWAFKGSNGGAIIKLLGPIKVDAVSLEHISKSLSPVGDVTTAPKDFSVWGLRSPTDRGSLLGQFVYKIDGPLVQTFSIHNEEIFDFMELKVMSNHGSFDFTCIYRFRVHGMMNLKRDK